MPAFPGNAAPKETAFEAAPGTQDTPVAAGSPRYLPGPDIGLIISWIEIFLPFVLPNLIIVLYSILQGYLLRLIRLLIQHKTVTDARLIANDTRMIGIIFQFLAQLADVNPQIFHPVGIRRVPHM